MDAPQYKVARKIFYDFHEEMKALKVPLIIGKETLHMEEDGHIHNKSHTKINHGEKTHGNYHHHVEGDNNNDDTRSMKSSKLTMSR